jgi:enoyl-CoA hydratase
MDLILTGRGVSGDEALSMGLVDRVVEPGTALPAAVALAHQLAALPQVCMRNDRRSAIEQWGRTEEEAWHRELELGLETIASGETAAGAEAFRSGQGRHGTPR